MSTAKYNYALSLASASCTELVLLGLLKLLVQIRVMVPEISYKMQPTYVRYYIL